MLNKRTNILFDQELWNKLTKTAKEQKTSVGELVRGAVKEKYTETARREEMKQAWEEIERIRPHFKGKIDYKALINYGRKLIN